MHATFIIAEEKMHGYRRACPLFSFAKRTADWRYEELNGR
jgi:hypothetical protein